jgi:hypothetical protein
VRKTVAVRGDGVAALADDIDACARPGSRDGADGARRRMAHLLVAAVAELARDRAAAVAPSELEALCDKVLAGDETFDAAAAGLLRHLLDRPL